MSAIIQDLPELRHLPANAPTRRRGHRVEIPPAQEHSTAAEAAPSVGLPRASLICLRFVRTTAPLLACDVLSLSLCGLLAFGILRLLAPGISEHVSLWTPLALAALSLGYCPGGLYPGIGVHPVVEVRQLTKVN